MMFSPLQYERVGLPVLLRDLAQRSASEVMVGLDQFARYPPTPVRGAAMAPTIEWRTTWLTAPDPYVTLPGPTHPPVGAADVELGEYLGGGNQGAVYSGRVRTIGLVVAVKVIRDDYAVGEGQAIREARIGAKLNHPNVLRVFEAQKAGAFWVVVMEFLQGKDLSSADLSSLGVKPLAAPLADALLAMAQARIVHRDIKPANIVQRIANGTPVIVDFGMAVDLETLTEHPGLGGSPLFMAPEAFTEEWPNPAWDAYSLGMTVVALLAKDRLPRSDGLSHLMTMKVQGQFDRQVTDLLTTLEDAILAAWCQQLLGEPVKRLSVLEQARSWPSVGGGAEPGAGATRGR